MPEAVIKQAKRHRLQRAGGIGAAGVAATGQACDDLRFAFAAQ